MFGAEKLEELLVSAAGADDLLARVEAVLADYRGKREPFDDATMMVVEKSGSGTARTRRRCGSDPM